MSKSESVALLKFKNKHLQENIVHYKAENVYLQALIYKLKDERRTLKDKLKKFITAINKIKQKYQLESHLSEELIKHIKNN